MTRMIAKAYRVADAFRAAGIPVVMGGPHVTEVPDEALGRDGGPRHADAMALGEADETWPRIVEDAAARRNSRRSTRRWTHSGRSASRALQDYPAIPWESLDLRAVQPHSGLRPPDHARTSGTPGRHFTSSPSNPDAAVLMDANSAR